MTAKLDNSGAVKTLKSLSEIPGFLKVITSEHLCGSPDPKTEEELAACNAYRFKLRDHRHFVVHDVVSIEGPDAKGRYRAYTEEGDYCEGYPEDLIPRLSEVSMQSNSVSSDKTGGTE